MADRVWEETAFGCRWLQIDFAHSDVGGKLLLGGDSLWGLTVFELLVIVRFCQPTAFGARSIFEGNRFFGGRLLALNKSCKTERIGFSSWNTW